MLVLTRRSGEAIVIGDGVELTVLEVKGDSVKLGIVAPRTVGVWRKELLQEVAQENRRATQAKIPDVVKDILTKK